jgi:hypothetical protein
MGVKAVNNQDSNSLALALALVLTQPLPLIFLQDELLPLLQLQPPPPLLYLEHCLLLHPITRGAMGYPNEVSPALTTPIPNPLLELLRPGLGLGRWEA